jgi:hypothetical protein
MLYFENRESERDTNRKSGVSSPNMADLLGFSAAGGVSPSRNSTGRLEPSKMFATDANCK